jgi:hypothetical protein
MSYKSKVNEYCQKIGVHPIYTISDRDGPSHCPRYSITCDISQRIWKSDLFPTKREAEEESARLAYKDLVNYESDEEKNTERVCETKQTDPVIILIDGDNVHEVTNWVLTERKEWELHIFVTQNTVVKQSGVKIHRSRTNLPDATDLRMILSAVGFLATLGEYEKLILVSRDSIFRTFVGELGSDNTLLCQTIEELKNI